MTTLTSPRPGTRTRSAQWRIPAAWMARTQVYLAAWVFGIAVVTAAVVLAVVSTFTPIGMSGLQFARQAMVWFPFSISIILVSGYLTLHVALGMTRRSFVRGAVVAALVTGVLYGVGVTVLLVLERAVYDGLGWPHVSVTGDTEVILAGGVLAAAAASSVVTVAGTVSGLLVGASYYRFGGWRGTFLLPLTLAPILLTSLVGVDLGQAWSPVSITVDGERFAPVTGPLTLLVAALVLAVSVLALELMVRRVPIAAHQD